MKNLFILLLAFVSVSCSDNNEDLEFHNKSNIEDRLTEFPDLSEDFTYAMSNFVESLRPYYQDGMSYTDFKNNLSPDDGLINIKREGDQLLEQAFIYIKNDVEKPNMSGDLFSEAFFAAIQYNEDMFGLDITEISENDYDIIFADLFGVTTDKSGLTTFSDGCKWYQLGCHASSVISSISTWWNTPAPGEGGMTNGQVLASTVATTAAIVGLVILLL
ncbi:MAG: hypothetical protein ACQESK_01545 [Bacteroidota bacterium]